MNQKQRESIFSVKDKAHYISHLLCIYFQIITFADIDFGGVETLPRKPKFSIP